MPKVLFAPKKIIVFGLPIFIIGLMVILAQSNILAENPQRMSLGITVDLVLIMPLIYLLLIWKTSIPKTTVVPLLILGIIVASWILPDDKQHYLSLFKTWVLPIVELSILSFVVYKVRETIKSYKSTKETEQDFFTHLKKTCYEFLPRLAVMPVVTEIAVFYYGFIFWRKRNLKPNEFSYHKDSTTISLFLILLFILAIETVAFHLLLSRWSTTAAWILTCLSIYSGLQIFGFLKSMLKRPISIDGNTVHIRYGIMSECDIELDNIESVVLSSSDLGEDKQTQNLSPLGTLEGHNTLITVREECEMYGLYGKKKKFKTLALHVDEKENFQNALSQNPS